MSEIKRKAILVFFAIEILALVLFIKENVLFDGKVTEIKRPAADQMERYTTLSLISKNGREDINIGIKPKARTGDEIRMLMDVARTEIDSEVFKNNEDADHVMDDLILRSSYAEGMVKASWSFDNADLVDVTGRIILSNLTEPCLVTAYCNLKIDEYEEVYSFGMRLIPPDENTKRGFDHLLEEAIRKENEKTKAGTFILPTSVGGVDLTWEEKKSNIPILLCIFGFLAAIAVVFGNKEDERKLEKERQKKLDEDYPEIVSSLSLYIGAGVNIKGALQRIAESYRRKVSLQGEKRPGYEGILQLLRQISDGAGELESITAFGRRIGNKNYRKLALLLGQNLRKGNATLAESLEKEEQGAFEERKLRAKIASEEASTKLLLPMMGLLGIVVVVLVFPAFIGMGI